MLELDWYKCYGESWTGEIVPSAFQHPAKFSRALIKRIYEHCIEQGWLTEGSKIVDPFGGVALGGFHALQHGMHWLGVELEPKFVDLGNGYDCPGFSKSDWRRFCNRARRVNHSYDFHWCPTCQATMDAEPVFGLVPEQSPHRYEGNIDLWNRRYGGHFRKWGTARLVQGDSRELRKVISGMVDGICTSPPWQGVEPVQDKNFWINDGRKAPPQGQGGYGQSPGQLAQMSPGNANAVITSSPYLGTAASDDPDKRGGLYRDPKRRDDVSLTATYGESEGQLAGMEEGDMVLTSPPYVESLEKPSGIDSTKSEHKGGPHSQMNVSDLRYGDTPGQIGKESGTTFWSAARIIVSECFEILKPNGIAAFVVKSFVRKKKIVDFPGQWQRLCESVGFETIEFIRAWLIEERGQQYDLFGELHTKTVQHKSFFRLLSERKGSPKIDFEVVLVMQKPATASQ